MQRRRYFSLTSKYCPSMKGLTVSSLSSGPQSPSIMEFLTTMPSLTRGFMWNAMSLDRLAFRLMLNLQSKADQWASPKRPRG